MKKGRVEPGEKCPVCGAVFKDGDRARLVDVMTVYRDSKKKTTNTKKYLHEKCADDLFPKKVLICLKRKKKNK